MTVGAWRRWSDHPSPEQLSEHMSERGLRLWQSLRGWLLATYGLRGEAAWTDEDMGWVLRYRRRGRSLLTLFPTADGGCSALVVLGPSLWGAVDDLVLGETTWEAYSSATAYADGRWLFLRVADAETVGDIRRLVALKAPPFGTPGKRASDGGAERSREPATVG